jgi:NAD(P)-dependent dehydrogenase (short-subunit alcohol dehydrogenase family)
VGSSSTRGGHPPFLAPYFAAKAGMDALAESYAAELIKFGIDTVIVVPGAYPSGTNHFAHVDPSRDGSEVVSAVSDRIRAEFYRRTGIAELLPGRASL